MCLNAATPRDVRLKTLHDLTRRLAQPAVLAAVTRSGGAAALPALLASLLPAEELATTSDGVAVGTAGSGPEVLMFWSPAFATPTPRDGAIAMTSAAPADAGAATGPALPLPSDLPVFYAALALIHSGLAAGSNEYVSHVVATPPVTKASMLALMLAAAEEVGKGSVDSGSNAAPVVQMAAAAEIVVASKLEAASSSRLLSSATFSALWQRGKGVTAAAAGQLPPAAPADPWSFNDEEEVDETAVAANQRASKQTAANALPAPSRLPSVPPLQAALDLLLRGVTSMPTSTTTGKEETGPRVDSANDKLEKISNNDEESGGAALVEGIEEGEDGAAAYGSIPAAASALVHRLEATRGLIRTCYDGAGLQALLQVTANAVSTRRDDASAPTGVPALPCLHLLEELTFGGSSAAVGASLVCNPVAAAVASVPLESVRETATAGGGALLQVLLAGLQQPPLPGATAAGSGTEAFTQAVLRLLVNVCHGNAPAVAAVIEALTERRGHQSGGLPATLAALLRAPASHDSTVCVLALLVNLAESMPAAVYSAVTGSTLQPALVTLFASRWKALGLGAGAGSGGAAVSSPAVEPVNTTTAAASGTPEDLCVAGYSCILFAWLLPAEDEGEQRGGGRLRQALADALGVQPSDATATAAAAEAASSTCPVSSALLSVLRVFMSRNCEAGLATEAAWAEAEVVEALLLGKQTLAEQNAEGAEAGGQAARVHSSSKSGSGATAGASGQMGKPSRPWSWATLAGGGGGSSAPGAQTLQLAEAMLLLPSAASAATHTSSCASSASVAANVSPSFWAEFATLAGTDAAGAVPSLWRSSGPALTAAHAAGTAPFASPASPTAAFTGWSPRSSSSSYLTGKRPAVSPCIALGAPSPAKRPRLQGSATSSPLAPLLSASQQASSVSSAASSVPVSAAASPQLAPSAARVSAASSVAASSSSVSSVASSSTASGSSPREVAVRAAAAAPSSDPFAWGAEEEAEAAESKGPAWLATEAVAAGSGVYGHGGLATLRLLQVPKRGSETVTPGGPRRSGPPPHGTTGPSEHGAARRVAL